MKYNLTFWQKLELIPLRLGWLAADPSERKSWHLVKKGMEKHEHNFVLPTKFGEGYLQCNHEGCTEMTVPDFKTFEEEYPNYPKYKK